jgi:murein DD-endopeptidase MepM/ murein hydrolase activator NlpD
MSGSASNLEVLMTCTDISSILTRSQMIKSVSEKDSKALNDLMERMSEIETAKAELEASINKLDKDKTDLEKEKKERQDNINRIASTKAELDKEAAEANAIIRSLKGKQGDYYEEINTNKSEIAKIEREIQANIIAAQKKAEEERQKQGGGGYVPEFGGNGGNGRFRYPTDYRGISSGFYRRSGAYHGAIDFPCPTGSNVYAGADGVVITATWHYSYGNYVAIDHGGGFSTLYAHNSRLLVSVGQHVSRGQVIAKSGSTGNSTGPHCHFEVRINGARVNPLNYL